MPRFVKGDPNLTWERYVEIMESDTGRLTPWKNTPEEYAVFEAVRDGFEIDDATQQKLNELVREVWDRG